MIIPDRFPFAPGSPDGVGAILRIPAVRKDHSAFFAPDGLQIRLKFPGELRLGAAVRAQTFTPGVICGDPVGYFPQRQIHPECGVLPHVSKDFPSPAVMCNIIFRPFNILVF